jgi:hypothetical protein
MLYSALDTPVSEIPDILTIQKRLVKAGKMQEDRVGSTDWIEPPHAAALLSAPHGVCSVSAKGLKQLYGVIELQLREQRLPAMVDDSIKAYVVGGLRSRASPETGLSEESDDLEAVEVLVFDPHVAKVPTAETLGDASSAVRWVSFKEFFETGALSSSWMHCCLQGPVEEG